MIVFFLLCLSFMFLTGHWAKVVAEHYFFKKISNKNYNKLPTYVWLQWWSVLLTEILKNYLNLHIDDSFGEAQAQIVK